MICNNCGKEIPEDDVFCSFCGVKIENNAKEEDADEYVRDKKTDDNSIASITYEENSSYVHNGETWKCPECDRENEAKAVFCIFCGHSRPNPRVCCQCGELLNDYMDFCPKCGTKYDADKVEEPTIRKEVPKTEEIHQHEAARRKQPKKGNRNQIIIIVVAAVVLAAVAVAAFMFLGGDKTGNTDGAGNLQLKSIAVHADPSDEGYEVAVILQVGNRSKDALTNVTVKTSDGQSFAAYGYVPAGEEGLMAGLLSSDQIPEKDAAYQIETTDSSFVSSTAEYHQMNAVIIDGGTNVTMETAHGANGYATDWNDDDFAEYMIEIKNDNDKSFGSGETIGVAVVYDEKMLKDGDIFYNTLGEINAGRTIREKAVLPKTLASDKNVKLVILPKSEVN